MPRLGSPLQSRVGRKVTENAEPYYSNEDIAVLHSIVTLAQELFPKLPDRERLPTNALFGAYYEISSKSGLKVDHDNRYARVLFKIGGLRGPGTLYEKFEAVLSRMGIEIEFDHLDDDEWYSHQVDSQTSSELTGEFQNSVHVPERRRRNSESQVWDFSTQAEGRSKVRRNSFDHSIPVLGGQNNTHDMFFETQGPPPADATPDRGQMEAYPPDNVRPWLRALSEKGLRQRGRSVSTHANMLRRRSVSRNQRTQRSDTCQSVRASDDYQAQSEVTAVTSIGDEEVMDMTNELHEHSVDQEAKTLMEIEARLLCHHILNSAAKRHLHQWRGKTTQFLEDTRILDLIATNHDRRVLLQAALTDWRTVLQKARLAEETERFFEHLQRRAGKARNLYLLHVAFTHWSARATEEVEKTSLARKHIIRNRVFNAWREITAVNDLKVRRQVLKKFFGVWQRRYSITNVDNTSAITRHEGNLAHRSYRQWLEKHWSLKATHWLQEGMKRYTLFRWIMASHNSWEDHRSADATRQYRLSLNTWQIWIAQTKRRVWQNHEAEDFMHANACRKAVRKWRHEISFIPPKILVEKGVKTRLLYETFGLWLHRLRQHRQAVTCDREKMLLEALTHWRHKVRSRVLGYRIDNRVIMRAIYKWTLAQKATTARRLQDMGLKHGMYCFWRHRSEATKASRCDQEDVATSFAIENMQNVLLTGWRSRTRHFTYLETKAITLKRDNLLHKVFSSWAQRAENLRLVKQWGRDSHFYFLASKTLKQWKTSAEAVKREKRKVAYLQTRRTKKLKLARGVLHTWQSQTRLILRLQGQALELSQNKDIIVGMNVFDLWRARAEELSELESICREKALRKYFQSWSHRFNDFQDLGSEAIVSYQEHRQTRSLKKWSLLYLQLRAQTHYTVEIREKNTKKAFRKMFLYWHQKALQSRPVKKSELSEDRPLGSTAKHEVWSELGEELEVDEWIEAAESITIPGYLTTPSRRSERVMAVTARFSTTPKAPLSTPFERQLRAQYSAGYSPASRRGYGRSTLGTGDGFKDIPGRDTINEK